MLHKKIPALLLAGSMLLSLGGCGQSADSTPQSETETTTGDAAAVADPEQKAYIEETLNLANNDAQAWTYSEEADAWVLSVVSAVAYPELPDQQGGIGLRAGGLCHRH